jgi:lipoate-protein ligase A
LVRSDGNNPHYNLALEQYLIDAVNPGEVILYLWQNDKTVVVGRNQNPWAECRADALRRDGVLLARRSSGGGAVYHDLGNVNFTFIAHEPEYDVDAQTGIVLDAVRSLGLCAEKTGRNDLTVEGFKFSGHAFTGRGGRHCHHGTVMAGVDLGALERYLNVSEAKLSGKGVKSVRARVRNLSDWDASITVGRVSAALAAYFAQRYAEPLTWRPGLEDAAGIEAYRARYASDAWNWGQTFAFDYETERRFPWGCVTLQLKIVGGIVTQARVFTDALDVGVAADWEKRLTGLPFAGDALDAWLAANA